ncbi:LpqB family beta-propeller domain-containing protein [Actinomadura logoneensis]|uniref:LpqB family beta-propeller domain-containing protein n=1 Tax=Actinomadura logoneensis TaxID=2293572 RepID=UPI001F31E643|nr:LpqB family beta-propeller domain-containing protein [Actinomadura logoneensis]
MRKCLEGPSRWLGGALKGRAAVATAAALTLCASGCAALPGGGRVTSVKAPERAEQADESYVRLIPVEPKNDWSPQEIVSGFLAASASFDDDHKVAKEYLANPNAWRPGPRPSIAVFDDRPEPKVFGSGDQLTVRINGTQLGIITTDGQYTAFQKSVQADYQLTRNAQHQWRISALPDALGQTMLLNKNDVDQVFRTFNLYYFAPDKQTLVPNGVFLPLVNREDLPQRLVQAVIAGPTTWLRGAVWSAFPHGTKLVGLSLDKDVATVDLSKEAASGDVEQMSAQLAWSLGQVSEIKQWRLRIEGRGVVTPEGKSEVQTFNDWQANTPDGTVGGEHRAYMIGAAGHLSTLGLNNFLSLPVVTSAPGRMARPAVSPDQHEVAGLSPDGRQLLSSDLNSNGVPRVLRTAKDPEGRFTPPCWDRQGTLWTVETSPGKSMLWKRERGKTLKPVWHWGLDGREIYALQVARDGVRVAVVAKIDGRKQVQVGRIAGSGDRIDAGSFVPVSSELAETDDLSWRDYNTLAVLGRKTPDTQVLPYLMPVDGSAVTSLGVGSLGEPLSIAAIPGGPVLIGTKSSSQHLVCHQSAYRERDSEWACNVAGSDPTYAF